MFDVLPFPNIMGETTEERIEQINSYLMQLKEELEFILSRISVDNLSEDLRRQLASLGADISTNRTEQETVNEQIINRALTVDDVTSSSSFNSAVDKKVDDIMTSDEFNNDLENLVRSKIPVFTVNMETGHLDYVIQGE